MKPKISPTSPKNMIEKDSQIDSLYRDHFETIQKPHKKNSISLWMLCLVVIIGFVSGIIGVVVILAYGSDLSLLDKFPFFTNVLPQVIINGGKNNSNGAIAQKTIDTVAASIVTIYEKQSDDTALLGAYSGSAVRGNGFILTDDGYIVTTKEVANTKKGLVVITHGGDIFEVTGSNADPATPFTYLKINASGLASAAISTTNDINMTEEVLVAKSMTYASQPVVGLAVVAHADFASNILSGPLSVSSESFTHSLLLDEVMSPVLVHGVVFSTSGNAIGMLTQANTISTVVPFSDITGIMSQIVGGQAIQRPYLGLQYIDISTTPGLPESLSQGLSHGALIYSDDETARPSIAANSPAQTAHLKKGDIITAIGDQSIDASNSFESVLQQHKPKDTIIVKVMRNKESVDVTVVLGEFAI